MRRGILTGCALLAVALAAAVQVAEAKDEKKSQWSETVAFETDYEAAIKKARESGKMILIYNGWEREKV